MFKNRAKTGSTVAVFNSMKDADYAFEQLKGVLATVWLYGLVVLEFMVVVYLFCNVVSLKFRCYPFMNLLLRYCMLDELQPIYTYTFNCS